LCRKRTSSASPARHPAPGGCPGELDLIADGEAIQFHIHQPGGSQPRLWVDRKALVEIMASWKGLPESDEITLPARTAKEKAAQVSLVFDDSDEVEVQAGWWIWVGKADLKAALAELGIPAPW
jgi:hypothetical protein